MKKGLVMEGGAMRGMFTCGVIDVFMENGIDFDGAIGVSAGVTFGCNIKSKQIGRALRYNKKYCNDPRYGGLQSLIKTGDLYNVEFCYHELPWKYDVFDGKTYRENPMEFYAVCTDMNTGEAVYHKCMKGDQEDVEWMRASASLPIVSKPVCIDGQMLADGGAADSIPIRYFESIGYDRNVVILTQPKGYVKKNMKGMPLLKAALRKTPKMYEAMACRAEKYNETLAYLEEKEASGEILVIRPNKSLNIGKVEKNPKELERVYQIGRKVALKRIGEIKKFLNEQ